jgi:hypothetical protein
MGKHSMNAERRERKGEERKGKMIIRRFNIADAKPAIGLEPALTFTRSALTPHTLSYGSHSKQLLLFQTALTGC